MLKESVLWEAPSALALGMSTAAAGMTIKEANQMRSEIGRRIVQSITDPGRYEAGTVGFPETQFVVQAIAPLVRRVNHPDDQPVAEIKGLDHNVSARISKILPHASRGQLLQMSFAEQMDRFGLERQQVSQLRRALIGIEGPKPDPKNRWDPPVPKRGERIVPGLIRLPLQTARKIVKETDLLVGKVNYRDSAAPSDCVLVQRPRPARRVATGTEIDLIVASGATVCIPDVIGRALSQALTMLREAGLESEPAINSVYSKMQSSTVLDVSPSERKYVTPHCQVLLRISRGRRRK
jgi:hypothetical protein